MAEVAESGRADVPRWDGVRLAVITSRLEGVVRNMTNTIVRTGRSGVLNTARDFSCAIMTADGGLIVSAESLPIHVMSGAELIARAVKELHPVVERGDAFLHNSPYHGNSHAADHCIVVPVIDRDGHHHFTVVVKAHQADCGNALPTTYMATARDVYEEGALIFPAVRVQKDYEPLPDVLRMCELRIRVPEQWRGDYLAMLGAARIGERELTEICDELGWDAVGEYAQDWFDYSEDRMATAISALPAADTIVETRHDPFPGVPDGVPLKIGLRVTSEEGVITVDLRDNPDCLPCGLNLTEATATTAAMIGVFNSIDHTVPANAGSFRRIAVLLRENCCVGIPHHPTCCSVSTSNLVDRVANAVQRGLAELAEGVGMAEAGFSIPASFAVISGRDPRYGGRPFVNEVFFASTAGAGGPVEDGWPIMMHVGGAGMMLKDSIEMDELHHPIRVVQERLLTDTEGAGRRRGAPAAMVEFGPVGCALTAMYTSDGAVGSAQGVRGGAAGPPTDQFKRLVSGETSALEPCGQALLEDGETLVSITPAGGGYGSALDREEERVLRDVAEAWISRERAAEVYGVVIGESGAVDREATARLRGQLTNAQRHAR